MRFSRKMFSSVPYLDHIHYKLTSITLTNWCTLLYADKFIIFSFLSLETVMGCLEKKYNWR